MPEFISMTLILTALKTIIDNIFTEYWVWDIPVTSYDYMWNDNL